MPAVRVMPVRSANVIWKGLVVISLKTASHSVAILLVFWPTALLRSFTDAYATKEDYETYKAIALGAQATAEEALALARQAIAIAQAAEASANDLSNAVGQNTSKIATLWDAVFSDITSNPFQITFADLTGITLKSGVWNASLQRLEC